MRIAHCSDLHLLSLTGARVLDFANKRWIGGLNLLANRARHYDASVFAAMIDDFDRVGVDHVICTGDVTNLALEQEFRYARSLFDRIALGPREITVLPGNHDAYIARGGEHFSAHFAPYHEPDEGWCWPGGERWPIVRVRGQVAIIGLSTSLQTPWFTAYGMIGAEQLTRLRQVLLDPRLHGTLRLVALHHPPAGAPARSKIRGLRDRDALAAVLAETGADLVIHGHEHQDLRFELPGPGGATIPVRGIQAGTYRGPRPERTARYRIFTVSRDARGVLVEDEIRLWDQDSAAFVTEGPALALLPATVQS